MKFVSTRGKAPKLSFSEALQAGLAPDGGLYVPERFPNFNVSDFAAAKSMAEVGERILAPFFDDDVLAPELGRICRNAFNFPVPLRMISKDTGLLELFHGPTAAFKDVGARFLAESVEALQNKSQKSTRTVLVATSGDTGGAVAAAFFGKPGIEVIILFPKGHIAPRQEKQLTAWGGNIRAFAVQGCFDDCQRLVKEAFLDPWWQKNRSLLSANSINIGRILPQTIYYAMASLEYQARTNRTPGFVVPSGNLGNAVAALWAKKMGLPVRSVVLACNANQAVVEYFKTGTWKSFATVQTLANAMDVGNPSNMERVLNLYPSLDILKKDVQAYSASDDEIRTAIVDSATKTQEVICPHTAAGAFALSKLSGSDWVLVATAHPAKFETIVEPLIGRKIPVPAVLTSLLSKPSRCIDIESTLEALRKSATN